MESLARLQSSPSLNLPTTSAVPTFLPSGVFLIRSKSVLPRGTGAE